MNIKSLLLFTGLCFLMACSPKDNANTATNINNSPASTTEEKPKDAELSFENTRWKSTDDPKSAIEVKNGKWNSLYDGEQLSIGQYKLEKKADGSILTINEAGEVYNYTILKHTDTELQMALIGGRGNTLSYEKD